MKQFEIQIREHLQADGNKHYTGRINLRKIFKLFWCIPIPVWNSYFISIADTYYSPLPEAMLLVHPEKKFTSFTQAKEQLDKEALAMIARRDKLKGEEVVQTINLFD